MCEVEARGILQHIVQARAHNYADQDPENQTINLNPYADADRKASHLAVSDCERDAIPVDRYGPQVGHWIPCLPVPYARTVY